MEGRIAAEKARQRETLSFSGVIAFAKPWVGWRTARTGGRPNVNPELRWMWRIGEVWGPNCWEKNYCVIGRVYKNRFRSSDRKDAWSGSREAETKKHAQQESQTVPQRSGGGNQTNSSEVVARAVSAVECSEFGREAQLGEGLGSAKGKESDRSPHTTYDSSRARSTTTKLGSPGKIHAQNQASNAAGECPAKRRLGLRHDPGALGSKTSKSSRVCLEPFVRVAEIRRPFPLTVLARWHAHPLLVCVCVGGAHSPPENLAGLEPRALRRLLRVRSTTAKGRK
jgi:hypothetical protein